MPIYTRECPRGHHFDHRTTIAEMDEDVPCPGRMAEPGDDPDKMPELVPCGAPTRRLPVPSSPASFVMK